ncbi:MAG: hypothetical protein OEY94_09805 [Alphaproteobacteria bacterium]|nr:hypothetical protein [Alphaproteobacteria bacterium]
MATENNDFDYEESGETKPTTERSRILVYYIIMFGSLVLICMPSLYLSLISTLICCFTLAAVYSARFNSEEDSLTENHMTYLIHTFWYTMLFLLYSVIAGLTYLLLFANYHVIGPCLELLPGKLVSITRSFNIDSLIEFTGSCAKAFTEENSTHLLMTSLIAFLPVIMYLLYRFIKGWTCISKAIPVPMKNE